MQVGCTACGAVNSFDALLADEDARRSLGLFTQLPAPLVRLAPRYVALYRPAKNRLTWRRAATLAGELKELIDKGTVKRGHGAPRPAPAHLWAEAMRMVLDRAEAGGLDRPLKGGHGYLLTVLYDLSDKADAKHERTTEARRQAQRPAEVQEEGGPMPADALEALTKLGLRK